MYLSPSRQRSPSCLWMGPCLMTPFLWAQPSSHRQWLTSSSAWGQPGDSTSTPQDTVSNPEDCKTTVWRRDMATLMFKDHLQRQEGGQEAGVCPAGLHNRPRRVHQAGGQGVAHQTQGDHWSPPPYRELSSWVLPDLILPITTEVHELSQDYWPSHLLWAVGGGWRDHQDSHVQARMPCRRLHMPWNCVQLHYRDPTHQLKWAAGPVSTVCCPWVPHDPGHGCPGDCVSLHPQLIADDWVGSPERVHALQ